MSMEEDIGYLKGKMESAEQNSQIFHATMFKKFDDMDKKQDKVLLVAGDVKRNKKSIGHLWKAVVAVPTLIFGGNMFGAWWLKR